MRIGNGFLWSFLALTAFAAPANATLISVTGPQSALGGTPSIIAAPANVKDAGAWNLAPQGFDEVQNYLLTKDIAVDHGKIAAGTMVSSHMIFFNNSSALGLTPNQDLRVQWTFEGDILGVMSDVYGRKEIATSSFLGAPGTIYPTVPFYARGLESEDSYFFQGNILTLNTHISQPGDWIRVVTTSGGAAVPEPMSLALVGSGMAAAMRTRRRLRAQ